MCPSEAASDEPKGTGWLVLVYRVPSEPTRLRATVWRRLKGLGAVYLQNSIAAFVACHEHGTVVARFLPLSWDHLCSQSWDHPARLAGRTRYGLFDHRVSVVDAEVNGNGIQGGQRA